MFEPGATFSQIIGIYKGLKSVIKIRQKILVIRKTNLGKISVICYIILYKMLVVRFIFFGCLGQLENHKFISITEVSLLQFLKKNHVCLFYCSIAVN